MLLNKLKKEAQYIPIILSLFLVPIFYGWNLINAFVQGKELLFKTIILVTYLSLAILLFVKKKFHIKDISKSLIFAILTIEICIFAITNILSETPIVTLYGTYSRGFGFIIDLFLFTFILYCSQTISRENTSKFLKTLFYSSLIVALYGALQKAGIDPLFKNFATNIFDGRIFSFSGNPGYLGELMLLSLLSGIYLSITEQRKAIYILGSLLIISALLMSGTRTSILGLAIAILLICIKYIPQILKFIRKNLIPTIIVTILTITIASTLITDRFSFSGTALRSLNSRFEIWKGAISLIEKETLTGYGGETFYIYSPEIITKKFLTLEENLNTQIDRIHNETLEIFFAHGIFATILYLLLLIILVTKFIKTKDKELSVLYTIVIANFIQNQLAFPDITVSIINSFCLGGIIAIETGINKKEITIGKIKKIPVAISAITIITILFFNTVYKPYMSQLSYSESKKNYDKDYSIAINKHKEAISYTPYYSELWYELMIIDQSSMERALYNLEIIEGNSGNVLAWKGNLYSEKKPQKATEFYTKALEKNPYYPNWIRAFADMLYSKGDYENALILYYQYLESIPDFWKWKDDLGSHSKKDQNSYKTFIKTTPYFWGIIEKINNIIEKQ